VHATTTTLAAAAGAVLAASETAVGSATSPTRAQARSAIPNILDLRIRRIIERLRLAAHFLPT
jgi:hypothetical protein